MEKWGKWHWEKWEDCPKLSHFSPISRVLSISHIFVHISHNLFLAISHNPPPPSFPPFPPVFPHFPPWCHHFSVLSFSFTSAASWLIRLAANADACTLWCGDLFRRSRGIPGEQIGTMSVSLELSIVFPGALYRCESPDLLNHMTPLWALRRFQFCVEMGAEGCTRSLLQFFALRGSSLICPPRLPFRGQKTLPPTRQKRLPPPVPKPCLQPARRLRGKRGGASCSGGAGCGGQQMLHHPRSLMLYPPPPLFEQSPPLHSRALWGGEGGC